MACHEVESSRLSCWSFDYGLLWNRFRLRQYEIERLALRSYTINNAYAAFEEDVKGSLTSGKLADVVVLSKDIMTIPEDEIPSAEVVYTILGGHVAYSSLTTNN
jgi:predicted amidohydrolase YtcJ